MNCAGVACSFHVPPARTITDFAVTTVMVRSARGDAGSMWMRRTPAGRSAPFFQLAPPSAETERIVELPSDIAAYSVCLLYTSDAADDLLCVDLGGRRIIK